MSKPSTITGKLTCDLCHAFLGVTRSDGSGPIFHECPHPIQDFAKRCPARGQLSQYEPKHIPLGLGGRAATIDDDAGSYRSIAVRELEDGRPDED